MAEPNGFILSVYELDLAPVGERHLQLPIRIGRSSLNDVAVSHRLVSEFHARVEDVDGKLCVRDLSSKNGVLVEAVNAANSTRIAAQTPVDLEPYGFEFLLSPLLRVRVRPASSPAAAVARHSQAVGSVLGNAGLMVSAGSALAEDKLTEAFVAQRPPAMPPAGRNTPPAPTPALSPAALLHTAGSPPKPAPIVPGALHQTAPPGQPVRILPARPQVAPPTLDPPAPLPGAQPFARGAPSVAYPGVAGRPLALGDSASAIGAAPISASPAVQPYASVFIESPSGPLELPALAGAAPQPALAPLGASEPHARVNHPAPGRRSTVLEPPAQRQPPPQQRPRPQPRYAQAHPPKPEPRPGNAAEPLVPALAHAAWEAAHGTMPAGLIAQAPRAAEPPQHTLDSLALRGLRELAASLVPGQPVESARDVVQLITKLHDALEMFCRCFIPIREACSRFIPLDELERAALERCRHRSGAYVAIERALEPRAVAAALLDWRNDAQDAPRAVEQILADLMLHHLGLSQAALDGTRALLHELSPGQVEASVAHTPSMLSFIGLADDRERALWNAYSERHADLESAGQSFRELYGEEFSRAFGAQVPGRGSDPPA